jgi:hypothetical protein
VTSDYDEFVDAEALPFGKIYLVEGEIYVNREYFSLEIPGSSSI